MSTRRPNNDGGLYYREGRNKPWVGQISMDGGERISKSFKLQRDAKKWLDDMKSQVYRGMDAQMATMTLKRGYERWLWEGEQYHWTPKTYKGYASTYKNHIKPNLDRRLKIIETRPQHIRRIINTVRERGAGSRTLQLVLSNLHAFFEDLKGKGFQKSNPVTMKVNYSSEQAMMPLSDDEIGIFLTHIQNSRLSTLYHVALKTGMRSSELAGLQWRYVDFENQAIYVRWQFARAKKGRKMQKVKTPASRRRITLGPNTIQVLREHQRILAIEKQGADRWEENDLVFPSTVGTSLYPSNVRKNFKQILKKADLPNIRLHDLRHTMASLWLRRGINPKVVQERLGHSTVRITLDLYSHLIPTLQIEAVEEVDDFISTLGSPGILESTEDMDDFISKMGTPSRTEDIDLKEPIAAKLQPNEENRNE